MCIRDSNYHADPANHLTNTSLIWGDYYLLEALLQYQAVMKTPGTTAAP